MNATETAALTAVFHMQLNTRDAVHYIMGQAGVDRPTAEQAVTDIATAYKRRRAA